MNLQLENLLLIYSFCQFCHLDVLYETSSYTMGVLNILQTEQFRLYDAGIYYLLLHNECLNIRLYFLAIYQYILYASLDNLCQMDFPILILDLQTLIW